MAEMDPNTRALYEATIWEHLHETSEQIAEARRLIAEMKAGPMNAEMEDLLDEMLEDFRQTAALIDEDADWLLVPPAGHA